MLVKNQRMARARPVNDVSSGCGTLRSVARAAPLRGQAVSTQAGPWEEAVSLLFKGVVKQLGCQPDISDSVTVNVRVGGSEIPVLVSRKAVDEAGLYPGTAAGTVRRAIGTGLRDTGLQ